MSGFLRLTVLVLAASLAAASSATADEPIIRVTGEATLSVPPDRATIDLGVETENRNAGQVASENARKVDSVIQQLRKRFGKNVAVKTLRYSITPRYRYPKDGGQREKDGFTATNVVRVETGALDQVGNIIDAATASGANRVEQLQFSLRDEEATRAEALRAATRSARSKAQAIAEALGLKVGDVISVDESGVSLPPVQPQLRMMSTAGRAATPVEAGNIEVRAELTLSVEATR